MSDKKILKQILSNTEEVKEVVISKENERQKKLYIKQERRKNQLRESQKRFIQIKANVKPELYDRIKERCVDGNVSGYLLKLVENDMSRTPSLFEEYPGYMYENSQVSEELKLVKSELSKLNSMNFFHKLRWLFFKNTTRI